MALFETHDERERRVKRWIRKHRDDPNVKRWLRENPPPREWTSTPMQWVALEMPIGIFTGRFGSIL